jgi:sulfite exporter TauE/SafE
LGEGNNLSMSIIAYIGIAFGLGIMGSFHCLGMCGPIALSLPLAERNLGSLLTGSLLYNIGRAVTYSLMGLLVGILGESIAFLFTGYQQKISILIGVLLLLSVLLPALFNPLKKINPQFYSLSHFLKSKLSIFLNKKGNMSLFMIGVFNGLLPCGMVYTALTAAFATMDVSHSALFMFVFGLGTLPAMLFTNITSGWINQYWRSKLNKLIPYVTIAMAALFILRGLNLGIPYLSPSVSVNAEKNCVDLKCCPKK